ncbi:MAG: hypothetical protein IPL61_31045 [Myxococcales bacterium]|nr:hypothetical protein [Myxococcales bacterium]
MTIIAASCARIACQRCKARTTAHPAGMLHLPAGALGGAAADGQVRGVVRRVAHPVLAVADVAEGGSDRAARNGATAWELRGEAAQLPPDGGDGVVVAQQRVAVPALPVAWIAFGLAGIDDLVEVAHQVLEVDEHDRDRGRREQAGERVRQRAQLGRPVLDAVDRHRMVRAHDPRDVLGDPARDGRRVGARLGCVPPRAQLVALPVVDAHAPDPCHSIVVVLRRRRRPLVRLGAGGWARGVGVGRLAHAHRHPIDAAADGPHVGRQDVDIARGLLEPLDVTGDLVAQVGGSFREERPAGWCEPDDAQGPGDATAASIGPQLADDARHVRRHLLDDPCPQFDRLDRRAVVHTDLPVERLVDVVVAPATVVGRRRGLREAPVAVALDLNFGCAYDQRAQPDVGAQPERVARDRRRGILFLLERGPGSQLLRDLTIDDLGEATCRVAHDPHGAGAHGHPPAFAPSGRRCANTAASSTAIAAAASSRSSNVAFGPTRASTSRSIISAILTVTGSSDRGRRGLLGMNLSLIPFQATHKPAQPPAQDRIRLVRARRTGGGAARAGRRGVPAARQHRHAPVRRVDAGASRFKCEQKCSHDAADAISPVDVRDSPAPISPCQES